MAKVNTDAVSLGVSRIRALREAAFWILAGFSLILLFALTSYRPDDPAFSVTGSSDAVLNLMGPWGAWFADISFHVVGLSAYLFPVLVLIAGLLIFREPKTALNRWNRFYRPAGFVLAVATSSGLATLHFTAPELRETAGGLLGQATGFGLESVLGHLGATVCLLVFWLSSVSLATGVSWMSVMERVGRGTLAAYAGINVLIERVREQRDGKRAKIEHKKRIVRSRKKAAERPPRIEPTFERVETSSRTEREKQVSMFEAAGATAAAELPKLSLLDEPPAREGGYSTEELEGMSRLVEHKLSDFGIEVEVVAVHPGPVVTRFELKPAPGVKVSQISNLAKDLARSLSTVSVRVVEVIPGKPFVGLEIPNEARELVVFAEIVRSEAFDENKSPLTLALGKGIGGRPIVADLLRMPHLLIAGTTGSGKSVALNAMVLSLLYKSTPEQVRLIMIDPKMLELSVYEGIPHLLSPVVTDMKEAANALRWCVAEMERRYKLMAGLGVRHISGYNRRVREAIESGKPLRVSDIDPGEDAEDAAELTPLPFVVVIIDELADMMMMVGKKVEELIARLAQKARASGIHMIIATQRPSVDVITGLIKANIPCRIAFQVSAKVDSRTILDQMGAETLLGHGDMLYLPPGVSQPTRIHGAFVSDNEVHTVVQSLRASGEPEFVEGVLADPTEAIPGLPPGFDSELDSEKDALYDQAVRIVTETRKASISGIQRRLKIGYNRAARMVEAMEEAGIVGSLQSNGFREVLAPPPPADG